MREECITAVRKAAGELKLTDADIEHIEHHIREAWLQEGFSGSDFSHLPINDKISRVSSRAKESFFSDSSRLKPYELLAELQSDGVTSQTSRLEARLIHRGSFGGSIDGSISQAKRSVNEKFSKFKGYGSKYLGFVNDFDANRDLLLALRGEKNVRSEALEIAKVFHEVGDFLLKEYKLVGGRVHPLDNWGSPQPMDFRKISGVSKEAFVDKTLPRLDHSEYRKRGIQDSDSLRSFLGEVYETLASEGRNKVIASKGKASSYGTSLGGRLRQPRYLFYSPQGLVDGMKEFGSEVTADGMMSRAFDNLIRDIEVTREFGVAAHENFEFVLANTLERDKTSLLDRYPEGSKKRVAELDKLESMKNNAKSQFERLTRGKEPLRIWDKVTDTALAYTVVTKMGKQVIYVPVDMVNAVGYASHRIGTSWGQTVKEIWGASPISKLTNKEKNDFINHITVGIEHARLSFSHELETSSRSVVGVMAKKVMDWQGLTALDNMVVRGLSASLQNYVGGFTRNFKDMASLKKRIGEQSFKAIVEDHRFSERDLKLLSMAEVESFKGRGTYLTDDHIYNISVDNISNLLKTGETAERVISDLANKYRTLIWSTVQEHARGSVGASMRDTKYVDKRGLGGNLLRLVSQFLIMPISFARMHLIELPSGMVGGGSGISANVYRANVMATTYIAEELIKNVLVPLISGKEPRFDITNPLDYAKAIVNAVTHYERFSPLGGGQSNCDILGPALGQAGRLVASAHDDITKSDRRRKGKAQAGLMKEVLNTTVPFQNMWYTKSAFDHFIREKLDDAINPGGRKRAEVYRRKKIQRDKRK